MNWGALVGRDHKLESPHDGRPLYFVERARPRKSPDMQSENVASRGQCQCTVHVNVVVPLLQALQSGLLWLFASGVRWSEGWDGLYQSWAGVGEMRVGVDQTWRGFGDLCSSLEHTRVVVDVLSNVCLLPTLAFVVVCKGVQAWMDGLAG